MAGWGSHALIRQPLRGSGNGGDWAFGYVPTPAASRDASVASWKAAAIRRAAARSARHDGPPLRLSLLPDLEGLGRIPSSTRRASRPSGRRSGSRCPLGARGRLRGIALGMAVQFRIEVEFTGSYPLDLKSCLSVHARQLPRWHDSRNGAGAGRSGSAGDGSGHTSTLASGRSAIRPSEEERPVVESPVCPNCGEELRPEDLEKRSCSNCGANLQPHSPQSEPAGP
jgi:hypothetical protein